MCAVGSGQLDQLAGAMFISRLSGPMTRAASEMIMGQSARYRRVGEDLSGDLVASAEHGEYSISEGFEGLCCPNRLRGFILRTQADRWLA